jgi:hypothetical protein
MVVGVGVDSWSFHAAACWAWTCACATAAAWADELPDFRPRSLDETLEKMLLVIDDVSEKDRTEPLSKMLGASSDRFEDWYVDVDMIEAWSSGMAVCDRQFPSKIRYRSGS